MGIKGSKLVRWNAKEISMLASAALDVYLRFNPGEKYLWEVVAMSEVQVVLPHDRRRKITGWALLPDALLAEFQVLMAKYVAEHNQPPEVYEIEKEVIVEPSARDVRDVLDSVSNSELFEALARRGANLVEGIINFQRLMLQATQASIPAPVQPLIRPPVQKASDTPPTVRPPKVVIYGFLDSQEANIREKAADFKLELVFIRTEGKLQGRRPSAGWHVVNITKVSHKHTDGITASSGHERILYVRGIDSLMKTLADINAKVGQGEH